MPTWARVWKKREDVVYIVGNDGGQRRCVYIVLIILGPVPGSMGYDALSWIYGPHKHNAVRKVENSSLDEWEMDTQ
jgi:hypothetical protein